MTQLIGEYQCKIDAKGRISLPSGLKRQIPTEADEKFVVNRGFEKCLIVYPKNEWAVVTEKINKLNQYKKEVRQFIRHFFRGATELEMDGASRINLPNSLISYANLTKEVVLFAHTNKIEIWEKAAYDQMLDGEMDDFGSLAESVMGEIDLNASDDD